MTASSSQAKRRRGHWEGQQGPSQKLFFLDSLPSRWTFENAPPLKRAPRWENFLTFPGYGTGQSGVLANGCARAACENCKHSILIAFSCKRRALCPSCQAKRAVIFAEHLHEEVLLPHEHRHLIFTIPKRLRIYFRYDRTLLKNLYTAAWDTWQEFIRREFPYGSPGAVMALHTAGDLLKRHPHMHAIAVNGVVADDGAFLVLASVDPESMTICFRDKVFKALLDEQLLDQETVENMKSWEHFHLRQGFGGRAGFQVYAAEPIAGDDDNARQFLARYLKKSPVSLERIHLKDTAPEPSVVYFKQQDDGDERYRSFSPLEFLAELQQHIPDRWEQTSRFFGCYACRTRGAEARKIRDRERLEQLRFGSLPPPEQEPAPAPSRTWASCMKRVFEINPLKCPRCNGEMKIIAFIQDPREIKKIANHLGLVTWRAPPPFAAKSAGAVVAVSASGRQLDSSSEFSQLQ